MVQVPWLRGKIYGGDVGGEARIVLGAPARFDLKLNAARIRLEDIAKRDNLSGKSRLEGPMTVQLTLSNKPDEKTGYPVLQGGGSLDVPNGKMLDLPPLIDLIKLAKLRAPDQTGFEEAHALFRVRGDRVKFGQLDLHGNAVSLGGEGEMNLDGSDAKFEFYTVWTNLKTVLGVSGDIPAKLSSGLYKIKVSGDLDGKLDYRQEPVPVVVEPIRRVLGRK